MYVISGCFVRHSSFFFGWPCMCGNEIFRFIKLFRQYKQLDEILFSS
jgi:hypothetical protein